MREAKERRGEESGLAGRMEAAGQKEKRGDTEEGRQEGGIRKGDTDR